MKSTVRLFGLAPILLAVACAAPAVPSPLASTVPAVPSPSGSTEPASAAPDRASASALPVEWLRLPASPSLTGASIEAVVALEAGFAAVGCARARDVCEEPAAWLSRDGRDWAPPISLPLAEGDEGGLGHTAADGPRGLVVAGSVRRQPDVNAEGETRAALWFSSDGASFERVADDESFGMASVSAVQPLGAGFAAIGFGAFTEAAGFRAWWSDDGSTWRDATPAGADEAFALHLLPAVGDGLVAWGPSCGVCVPETAWWSTPDGSIWTAEGTAPGLEGAHLEDVTVTTGVLLAAGSSFGDDGQRVAGMWQGSADRSRWSAIPLPGAPRDASFGLLLAVGDGVVGAGMGSVGEVPSALVIGRAPGTERWHELAAITGLTPIALLRQPSDPRGVILIGRAGTEGRGDVVTWLGNVDWAP